MILGMVSGTVVASERSDNIDGARYLIVETCNANGLGTGEYLIALDDIGAGNGEMVLLSQGSSSRQTEISKNRAVDAIVIGIVDSVYESDNIVYRK